jgi:hypothetical protein
VIYGTEQIIGWANARTKIAVMALEEAEERLQTILYAKDPARMTQEAYFGLREVARALEKLDENAGYPPEVEPTENRLQS